MSLLEINIRSMAPDDLDAVVQIDQSSFSLPWPKSSFNYELNENEASRCLVAEITRPVYGNMVIGMAVVWMVVDEAHIATIAVLPQFRRMGVAKRMLEYILNSAVQEGMQTVTLEVRPSNFAAQELYRGFGFSVVGRRLHYYHDTNEDAMIMTRFL